MTQYAVAKDGVRLAYESAGAGASVILVHGFASSRAQNWKDTGWYRTLNVAGYRVVAMDCRGHGESDKPHDVESYGHELMAEDVLAVMSAADAANAFVMGYSMGGFLSIRLLAAHPDRVRRLVLGGVGENYLGLGAHHPITHPELREAIAEALLTQDKNVIAYPRGRMFREFADQQGKDRVALAACMRAMSPPLPPQILAHAKVPVLVVCGETDDVAGAPGPLAALFADGHAVSVPARDHMTAVGDRIYKDAVVKFLAA